MKFSAKKPIVPKSQVGLDLSGIRLELRQCIGSLKKRIEKKFPNLIAVVISITKRLYNFHHEMVDIYFIS